MHDEMLFGRARARRTWLRIASGPGGAADLVARWEAAHAGSAWDRAIEQGAADPLLFAIAETHGRPDLADRVLARLERAALPLPPDAAGPYR